MFNDFEFTNLKFHNNVNLIEENKPFVKSCRGASAESLSTGKESGSQSINFKHSYSGPESL